MTVVTEVIGLGSSPNGRHRLEPAGQPSVTSTPAPAEACSVAGSTSVAADPGDTPRSDLRRTRCEARVPLASPAYSSWVGVEASGTHTPN